MVPFIVAIWISGPPPLSGPLTTLPPDREGMTCGIGGMGGMGGIDVPLASAMKAGAPVGNNLFFAALAGAIWCMQFVCFKTGEPSMGSTSYIGWAVLMASSIMFSGVLGLMLGEWKGTSAKTRGLLTAGLVILLGSAVIAGYSGKLGQQSAKAPAAPAAIEKLQK